MTNKPINYDHYLVEINFIARMISRASKCGVDRVSIINGLLEIVKSIFNWPINQLNSILKWLKLVLLHVVCRELSDAGSINFVP